MPKSYDLVAGNYWIFRYQEAEQMSMNNMRVLLFSVVFILLAVSCGGGSEPSSATQEGSSPASQTATDAKSGASTPASEHIGTVSPTETGEKKPNSSATDSDATDSSATDSDATDSSATDSDATDSSATDSDATDSSATDSDATDSSATDDGACLTDADSKTGLCVDGKPATLDEGSGFDEEKCQNATGIVLQQCMDDAGTKMEEDPALCETATGVMAAVCNATDQSSQEIVGPQSGHQNPCASLTGIDKEKCEESFEDNPYAKPTEDPNNTGRADPNARLATDEIDYSNIYLQNYDPDNLPKVAKANFTELDKFSRMTKIRSGVGHDFSYHTPEYDFTHSNCKSMKHYFMPVGVPRENAAYAQTPHTFQWMSIKFFSPVDGIVQGISYFENEHGTEAQFTIASTEHPGYYFMFFHLALDPNLEEGSVVQAGQQIATLGSEEAWGEIAVSAKIGPNDHRLLSFLQVATDEVLQEYVARGVEVPSDVIVTKEQRDATPLACDDSEAGWFLGSAKSGFEVMEFSTWVFESTDNWFFFDE